MLTLMKKGNASGLSLNCVRGHSEEPICVVDSNLMAATLTHALHSVDKNTTVYVGQRPSNNLEFKLAYIKEVSVKKIGDAENSSSITYYLDDDYYDRFDEDSEVLSEFDLPKDDARPEDLIFDTIEVTVVTYPPGSRHDQMEYRVEVPYFACDVLDEKPIVLRTLNQPVDEVRKELLDLYGNLPLKPTCFMEPHEIEHLGRSIEEANYIQQLEDRLVENAPSPIRHPASLSKIFMALGIEDRDIEHYLRHK